MRGCRCYRQPRRLGCRNGLLDSGLARYLADGAAGLGRSPRSDRKGRRVPAELVAVIEGLALRRPPPRVAEVHRATGVIAAQRGWKPPSYTLVWEIIAGLDRGLLALAHHDGSVCRDSFELVFRRESRRPNDLWQADHTELDVMVLDEAERPPGAMADRGLG